MNAKPTIERPSGGFRLMVFVMSPLVLLYFMWAWDRTYSLDDTVWPRPFPYPDCWIAPLVEYYDDKYPVEPGYIKFHGEFPRAQCLIACAGLTVFTAWLAAGIGLAWRAFVSAKSERSPLGVVLLVEVAIVMSLVLPWPRTLWMHLAVCAAVAIVVALACAIHRGIRASRLGRSA